MSAASLIAGITCSKPPEGMEVLLLFVVCCVGSKQPLRRTDHSFSVAVPVVFLIVCDLETSTLSLPRPHLGCYGKKT